jgi:hypothetical protein
MQYLLAAMTLLTTIAVAFLTLVFSGPAMAQTAASDDSKPVSAAEASVAPSTPAQHETATPAPAAGTLDAQAPKLDFNFFDEPAKTGPVSPANGGAEDDTAALARTRRHRLEVHQILGMTTWGLMLAASVVGQLNYNNLYGGGSGSGTYLMPHRLLTYSTAIMFSITAGYALFAPKPYPKPLKFDTGLIHRIAVIGASAGMVAQMVLGFITARTADSGNGTNLQRDAKIHGIIGWTTLGFMTAAGAVWVF